MRQYDKTLRDLNAAVGCNGEDPFALNEMAWLLAACPQQGLRNGKTAVTFAEKALAAACNHLRFDHRNKLEPYALGTGAAAYAEAGDLEKAIAVLKRALGSSPDATLRGQLERNLKLLE